MTPIKELNYFAGHFSKPAKRDLLQRYSANRTDSDLSDMSAEDTRFIEALMEFGEDGPRNDQEYLSLFAGKDCRLSGDISPVYSTASQEVAEHVGRLLPDIRIVFLVRHPLDRLKSALSMNIRSGRLDESVLQSWSTLEPVIQRRTMVERSFPSRIWKKWVTAVGEARCRFWLFDDIAEAPETVRAQIADFIGLRSPDFTLPANFNRKAGKKKFSVSPAINARLFDLFRDEIKTCRRIFGSRTADWPDQA